MPAWHPDCWFKHLHSATLTVAEAQVKGDGGGQQGSQGALLQLILQDRSVALPAAGGSEEGSRRSAQAVSMLDAAC